MRTVMRENGENKMKAKFICLTRYLASFRSSDWLWLALVESDWPGFIKVVAGRGPGTIAKAVKAAPGRKRRAAEKKTREAQANAHLLTR